MKILDACCGSRMFWFDKENPLVTFNDVRTLETELCDGRKFSVKPDTLFDFREMGFTNEEFDGVVFDPPHFKSLGQKSYTAIKYGVLNPETWGNDLKSGFEECFRVLKDNGFLIFKWNEHQILTSKVLKLSPYKPLIGHKSGKASKTHWVLFIKNDTLKV